MRWSLLGWGTKAAGLESGICSGIVWSASGIRFVCDLGTMLGPPFERFLGANSEHAVCSRLSPGHFLYQFLSGALDA